MTGGEAHEVKGYDALMELCEAQPEKLLGDKGCDADAIRDDLEERGIDALVPRARQAQRRLRKSTIVALARKLLVALWKYVTAGVVIDGAVVRAV